MTSRGQSGTKRAIKVLVKRGVAALGRFHRNDTPCARVLTYHSVGNRDHEMNVTPQDFREQMTWLSDNCPVISPREAATGKPGVAVTFDDGYFDNLTNAAPVLSKLSIPAVVFIVTGRMGGMLDHDSDPDTSTLLTWEQARELQSMGVEIGGHTVTHRRLTELTDSEQDVEIGECARHLKENLLAEFPIFAYPYGSAFDYNVLSKDLTKRVGYSLAFSNRYGCVRPGDDPWELRRIWIDATDPLESFQAKVEGRLELLACLEPAT
ncbi:MAG: polysaccharide deacetylase family protein, partial [Candidatus Hydrogenedentales bacterium]